MRPTPFSLFPGRLATCAVALTLASVAPAQTDAKRTAPAVAQGASLVGGALPGGAVISSAVASLTPVAGGGAAAASYAATGRAAPAPAATRAVDEDGSFSFAGLKPGAYEFRISFAAGPRQTTDMSATRQTPKTDFGSVVKAGDDNANAGKNKHETAMASIRNIKAREQTQAGGASVAAGDVTGDGRADSAAKPAVSSVSTLSGGAGGGAASASYAKENNNSGMPNRISINVTTPKQKFEIITDGDPVVVQVGADGTLTGRASVNQQQQGAEPATSGRNGPDPASPSGGPPPRPTGG